MTSAERTPEAQAKIDARMANMRAKKKNNKESEVAKPNISKQYIDYAASSRANGHEGGKYSFQELLDYLKDYHSRTGLLAQINLDDATVHVVPKRSGLQMCHTIRCPLSHIKRFLGQSAGVRLGKLMESSDEALEYIRTGHRDFDMKEYRKYIYNPGIEQPGVIKVG